MILEAPDHDPFEKPSRNLRLYRFFVRATRVLAIVFAGGLLVVFLIIPSFSQKNTPRSTHKLQRLNKASALVYRTLHQGNASVLHANEGRELQNGLVLLKNISGTLDSPQRSVSVQAPQGKFNQKNNTLDGTGGVTLTASDGTTISTPEAHIDTKKRTVSGQHPVQGEGPLGKLSAESFELHENGNEIILKGDSTLHLNTRSTR